jgi:uncharacterized protein YbbC (DUF1343 family)
MPVPIMYGMTIGELAIMWNEEGWLSRGVKADLDVIPLGAWRRSMWFDETGLPWVAPSPNLPRLSSAIVYPGQCLFEGSNASEGRGTPSPFETVGAPWADPERILSHLESMPVPGVAFTPTQFTPVEIPNVARAPKFEGIPCRGLTVSVTDRNVLNPVRLGISLLAAFRRAHPGDMMLRHRRFDILAGTRDIRAMIDRGAHPDDIIDGWQPGLQEFVELRERYLLYPR